jgi:7-keto-8-aminopelargonate synthetase-like enzyme
VRWLEPLGAPPLVFRHGDTQHVAELLAAHAGSGVRPLLLTDGVFAVSGDLAPIRSYLDLLARYPGAGLLVDDAHGLGVLGTHGRGSLELAGVNPRTVNVDTPDAGGRPRVFHTTTLSKAVGGQGGLIAGSPAFLGRIRRASGWLRGASAPASPVAAATAEGLKLMLEEPQLRERLASNVTALRRSLAALGLAVPMTPSPIIGFRLETGERMALVQQRLEKDGILVANSRDYSGAGPDGMLRIAVFATHTPEMIDRLVAALSRALTEE